MVSNRRLFPAAISHFFLLVADPIAAHLFAEIRWPALLPNVNEARSFGDFEILWMRRKAEPSIYSAEVYRYFRIAPCCSGKVSRENKFE